MPADQKAAAILWGNAMKEAIEDSRKEALKNRMSSNVIKGGLVRELHRTIESPDG
jgi:hypothetical protein